MIAKRSLDRGMITAEEFARAVVWRELSRAHLGPSAATEQRVRRPHL